MEFFNLCEMYRKDYISYEEKQRFISELSLIINEEKELIQKHFTFMNKWKYLFMTDNELKEAIKIWEHFSKYYQRDLKQLLKTDTIRLYRVGAIERNKEGTGSVLSFTDNFRIAKLFEKEKKEYAFMIQVPIKNILWSWQGDYDIENEFEYLVKLPISLDKTSAKKTFVNRTKFICEIEYK